MRRQTLKLKYLHLSEFLLMFLIASKVRFVSPIRRLTGLLLGGAFSSLGVVPRLGAVDK